MRFMIIIKSDEKTDAGRIPTEAELSAMSAFNMQMAEAGVMLAGEGLLESGKGARVKISGGKTTITDGPFTEAKEIVGDCVAIFRQSVGNRIKVGVHV